MPNWMTTRYDIQDDYIYIGTNQRQGAKTTDSDWYIRKFFFDAAGNPDRKEKRIGSWGNRNNLNWG